MNGKAKKTKERKEPYTSAPEASGKLTSEVSPLEKRIGSIENVVIAVILIVILMLATIFIQTFAFYSDVNRECSDTIKSLNQDLMDEKVEKVEIMLEYNDLKNRVEYLEKIQNVN